MKGLILRVYLHFFFYFLHEETKVLTEMWKFSCQLTRSMSNTFIYFPQTVEYVVKLGFITIKSDCRAPDLMC